MYNFRNRISIRELLNSSNVVTSVKYYLGASEFTGTTAPTTLEALYFSEGRITKSGANPYKYEYTIKDHLGNARVSFSDLNNDNTITASTEIIQEQSYYPFGLQHAPLPAISGTQNKYQYNGKEFNDELGLNWNDYGARFYMPDMGRWGCVDPKAELFRRMSAYVYCANNPIRFIDPDGMTYGVKVQESDAGRKQELIDKFKSTISNAFGGKVSANVDDNGNVTFSVNKVTNKKGKEVDAKLSTTESNALDELNKVANDKDVAVVHTVMDSKSEGAAYVDVGSYNTGNLDLDDIAAYGKNDKRETSKGKFVHEAAEQYFKIKNKYPNVQKGTKAFDTYFTNSAHKYGLVSENRTSNYQKSLDKKDFGGISFGGYNGTTYGSQDVKDANGQIINVTYDEVK